MKRLSGNTQPIRFHDPDGVIRCWRDYCHMMNGVVACVDGIPWSEDMSREWQFGWRQTYEQLEAMTVLGEEYAIQ